MRRDFREIQARARALLTERAGEPVDWTIGTMHDLRKSYATLMARQVPMHDLQKLMGQAYGAGHPISTDEILPQAAVPVKVAGSRFQSRCHVTQPQRLPGIVMQQVGAKNPQLVLPAQYPNLDFLKPHKS